MKSKKMRKCMRPGHVPTVEQTKASETSNIHVSLKQHKDIRKHRKPNIIRERFIMKRQSGSSYITASSLGMTERKGVKFFSTSKQRSKDMPTGFHD